MMSDQLPPPPVPPEVDLAGYGFMPLYGHRLFGSDFNARCSDAEWRAALTLWWASWNQVPAASLPDDDIALCRLAQLGRDVKGWRKLKANALHGFVKCSDGRLYHRVLARMALDAWDRRVSDRERKRRWRERINLSSDGPADADGDGDKGRDRDVDRDGDVRVEAKRSERDRDRERKSDQKNTPPQPPASGGRGVGVDSRDDDFEGRLTDLLDRLGVASGPEANRRWIKQAERNPNVREPDDVLRVIACAVRTGREKLGDRKPNGDQMVNHASDVREYFAVWRPREQPQGTTS